MTFITLTDGGANYTGDRKVVVGEDNKLVAVHKEDLLTEKKIGDRYISVKNVIKIGKKQYVNDDHRIGLTNLLLSIIQKEYNIKTIGFYVLKTIKWWDIGRFTGHIKDFTKRDKAVMEIVNKGNMSTLNCPEEVFLAEKLVELHPWSEMVRFARTGAEANSIAIRIARAATQKDNVAVCGYHGWHDWYLSANIGNNSNLNNHLLPGLSSTGVPKALKDTTFTFEYNQFEQLQIKNRKIWIDKLTFHGFLNHILN